MLLYLLKELFNIVIYKYYRLYYIILYIIASQKVFQFFVLSVFNLDSLFGSSEFMLVKI